MVMMETATFAYDKAQNKKRQKSYPHWQLYKMVYKTGKENKSKGYATVIDWMLFFLPYFIFILLLKGIIDFWNTYTLE